MFVPCLDRLETSLPVLYETLINSDVMLYNVVLMDHLFTFSEGDDETLEVVNERREIAAVGGVSTIEWSRAVRVHHIVHVQ